MNGSAHQVTGRLNWGNLKDMTDSGGVYRKREVGDWKKWFAWRPVNIHEQRVWLKTVYRRRINTYVDHDNWSRYEYGTIFDLIKQ